MVQSLWPIIGTVIVVMLGIILVKVAGKIIRYNAQQKTKKVKRYIKYLIAVLVVLFLSVWFCFFTYHGNTKRDTRVRPVETEGAFKQLEKVGPEMTKKELDSLSDTQKTHYQKRIEDPSFKKEQDEANKAIDEILKRNSNNKKK